MTQTPAGWYPDPYGTPQLRWWNGSQWTDATHPLVPAAGQAVPGASAGSEAASVPAPAEGEPSGRQRPGEQEPAIPRPAEPSPEETRRLDEPSPEQVSIARGQSGTPDEQGSGPVPHGFGAQGTGGRDAGEPPTFVLPGPGAGADPPTRQLPPQEQWASPSGSGFAGPPQGGFGQGAQSGPAGPQFAGWQGPPVQQGPGFAPQGGPAAYPLPGYPGGGPPRQRGGVWPWVLGGGGALIVLAAIIVAVVLVVNRDRETVVSQTPPPAPTEILPSVPSAPPTTPLRPLPSTPAPGPTGGAAGVPQPVDGRITDPVTKLSYEVPKGEGWQVPESLGTDPASQQWTSGVLAISQENYEGSNDWYGNVYTGELHEIFPYFGPQSLRGTVSTVFHVFESQFYGPPHERKVIQDKALKLGDRDAWVLELEFDFTEESERRGWKWKKERAAIVLVDRPDAQRPAILFISVPDNLDTSNVERVLNSLKLG